MKKTSYYTIITGASSGIGLALANEFAKNGHNLILVARREELLKEISAQISLKNKVSVEYVVADLTKPSDMVNLQSELQKKDYKINILVNNAGFGLVGEFSELELKVQQDMIDLNIKALVDLSYYFARQFKNQGFGWIMNVSSVVGFLPGPYMAVYYASKNFVTSFSLALAQELKQYNIVVTSLCPGYTDTKFQETSGMDKLSKLGKNNFIATTEQVAQNGYQGLIERSELITIPGFGNKLMLWLVKFVPVRIKLALVDYLQNAKTATPNSH